MTESQPVHASCVTFGLRGVLILGEPGSGKSSLALALIERGAMLVGDDYLHVEPAGNGVRARPVATLAGLIEVRGLGVLRLPWRRVCTLALQVRLSGAVVERYPSTTLADIAGAPLPLVALQAHATGNARVVELALSARGHRLMSPT